MGRRNWIHRVCAAIAGWPLISGASACLPPPRSYWEQLSDVLRVAGTTAYGLGLLYTSETDRVINGMHTSDGNKHARREFAVRKLLGRLSQDLFPGFTFCPHCGMSWAVAASWSVHAANDQRSGLLITCVNCKADATNCGLGPDEVRRYVREIEAMHRKQSAQYGYEMPHDAAWYEAVADAAVNELYPRFTGVLMLPK